MASATEYDVIVVGAGNAALCAALSAREQCGRVLVLEKASEEERGGNSTFTAGGFRFVHDGLDDLRRDVLSDLSDAEARQIYIPPLPADLYMHDLMRVTEELSQEELASLLIGSSRETVVWMQSKGVRFIPMFGRQSYVVNGMHHFYGGVNIEAVGGGWGLVDFLVKAADRAGIEIRYRTGLRKLLQAQDGAVTGVLAFGPNGYEEIRARAVVLACGGFESNPEMRTRYLGPGWELCRVRGTKHNTGDGIRAALDRAAVQIFDSQTIRMVRDEYRIKQVTKAQANTLEELAKALDIDVEGFAATVAAYNAACQPGDYNPASLDGKHTAGITPPKSNWALPINEPPYYGFVVTCGITFTFGGLRINTDGEVQDTTDTTIPGLYAAGELVGGIFYQNYLGGAGLMSGSVFGRLAGRSAGKHAVQPQRAAAE